MPRGKPTPEPVRAEVVRLYTVENLNIPETAARVNLPGATVYVILKGAGVDVSKKKRSKPANRAGGLVRWASRPNADEIDQAIRDSYPESGSKPVAERFGLTEAVVSMRAWRLGVKCTNWAARSGDTRAERGDNCNQEFFRTWSPNLAWLLGYTWADGTIAREKTAHRIGYRCSIKDEHIIHDIMKAIGSKASYKKFAPQPVQDGRYMGQEQIGFYVSSRTVVDLLIDTYGIPPNKSNIDPPFPNIPDEWLNHFTRGLIDGDGSICPSYGSAIQVVCYGSHQFIEAIRTRIGLLTGIRTPNRRKHGTSESLSRISWAAKDDVLKLLKWMYPEGQYLFLNRKRETAESYLKAN